jgi:hypothetical protein
MRAVILVVVLALLAAGTAQTFDVVNASRTTAIPFGCPVGRDTGVTVVPLYQVGNALSSAVIADSLQIGMPAITYTRRGQWGLCLKYRGVYSGTDTLDRFVYVTTLNIYGSVQTTSVRLTDSRPVDSVLSTNTAKVTRVQFRGRVSTDSFGLYAYADAAARGITSTTQWQYPYFGLSASDIPPRQKGTVWSSGDGFIVGTRTAQPGMFVVPGLSVARCSVRLTPPESGWVIGRVKGYNAHEGLQLVSLDPMYIRSVASGSAPPADTFLRGLGLIGRTSYAHAGESLAVDTAAMPRGGGGGTSLDTTLRTWYFTSSEFTSTAGANQGDAPFYRSGFGNGGWTSINPAYDTNGTFEIGALHANAQDSGDGVRVVLDHYFLSLGGNEFSRARWQVSYTDSIRMWVGIHDMDGDGIAYGVWTPNNGIYLDIQNDTCFCRAAKDYGITTAPSRYLVEDSVKYLSGVRFNADATRAYYEVWRWSDRVRVVYDSLSTGLPKGKASGVAAVYYNYGKGVHADFAQLFYLDFGVNR